MKKPDGKCLWHNTIKDGEGYEICVDCGDLVKSPDVVEDMRNFNDLLLGVTDRELDSWRRGVYDQDENGYDGA